MVRTTTVRNVWSILGIAGDGGGAVLAVEREEMRSVEEVRRLGDLDRDVSDDDPDFLRDARRSGGICTS